MNNVRLIVEIIMGTLLLVLKMLKTVFPILVVVLTNVQKEKFVVVLNVLNPVQMEL